ncbi:MAG: hypothetical protein AAFN27_17885 [Pseudomonadota bacterium]
MKIVQIRARKTALPYIGGTYVWGTGDAIETDSLVQPMHRGRV